MSRHSLEKWVGQFWNLLTLTEMHGVQDKKWFFLTFVLSFQLFEG